MALSFAFDPSKGESFESTKRKRAMAEQIAANIFGRAPRNVGEGLNAIGQAFIARQIMGEATSAEKAGQASAADAMGSIFSPFPAAPSSTDGAATTASTGGGNFRDAIASIESAGSGDYGAIGPTHKTLGRALGRYQVMEANIGPWSREALGREVTPQEFLENPAIQDAVFDHRFGSYVQKYGNPQDAASAWFTGQPLSVGANRRDVLGTTGNQYVDKFNRALGQPAIAANEAMATGKPVQTASLDPSIGMTTPRSAAPDQQFQVGAPASSTPAGQRVLSTMMNPQPMGGAPMPLQAGSAAPQASPPMSLMQPPAPTPAPVQVAQAQPMPEMAGNAPDMRGQTSGPSLQQLIQAASNPWLNDSQRAVVNMLLEQQMQAQDPMRQLDMDYKRAQIGKLQRDAANPNADENFFGNPIAVQNQDGSVSYGQIGNKGSFRPIELGEGQTFAPPTKRIDAGTEDLLVDQAGNVISRIPKDLRGAKRDQKLGELEGETAANLPTDLATAEQAITELDALISHPGLSSIAGPMDQFRPSWTMGAEGRDALARFNQAKGRAFLQAFGMLKGGGQITEIEGLKAEQAMARMDRAQSEPEFIQALKDFRDAVATGRDKLRQRAGLGGQVSTQTQTAPQRLKFNPATGELE